MQRVGIIGAGAWGTALAVVARRAGREAVIWALEPEVVAAVNGKHCNTLYLPDVALDPVITATGDVALAAAAEIVLLVPPAQHLRGICTALAPHLKAGTPVVICTKGIERGTSALMTDVVAQTLPQAAIMVLSGPTFAREVALGLPTAITLGAADQSLGRRSLKPSARPPFGPISPRMWWAPRSAARSRTFSP